MAAFYYPPFLSLTRSIVDLLLLLLLFFLFSLLFLPFKLDLSFEILKEDPPSSQLSIKKTYNDRGTIVNPLWIRIWERRKILRGMEKFGILQTDSILIFENFNCDWIISIHLQKNTTIPNFNTLLCNITSNTSIRIICIVRQVAQIRRRQGDPFLWRFNRMESEWKANFS